MEYLIKKWKNCYNESLIAAITGNATPADYEKAAQEWDARVPVDKGDLDKTNIER